MTRLCVYIFLTVHVCGRAFLMLSIGWEPPYYTVMETASESSAITATFYWAAFACAAPESLE